METQTAQGFWLSPQQERAWVLRQTAANDYRVVCAISIHGALQAERFWNAVDQTAVRYEILRTVFHHQPGFSLPFQIILEDCPLHHEIVDLSSLAEKEQQQAMQELFDDAKKLPFDLKSGPVLHVQLAKLASDKYQLVLALSALCGDSFTLASLVAEIAQSYATSPDKTLDDEVLQYADIAQWQRDLLESEETKAGREHWKQHLRKLDLGPALKTSLSVAKPGKPEAIFDPAEVSIPLHSSFFEKAKTLASQKNIEVQDVLLAGWQTFLARFTGTQNPVVGFAFDGRRYDELQTALGPLTRFLPVQLDLDLSQSFEGFLANAASHKNEVAKLQESSTWQQLATAADASDAAAFFFPFAFEYAVWPEMAKNGAVSFEFADFVAQTERFDLKLTGLQIADAFKLTLVYDHNRYHKADIEYLAQCYAVLMTNAVANPTTTLASLPLLDSAYRDHLLVTRNQTSRSYPHDTYHQLFEAQAEKTPEHSAVAAGGRQWTYRELNQRANQIAHALRMASVGADALVGLCLDRSVELLAAILGILKAGGAYVALNPENPKPRLQQQLSDVKALITAEGFLTQLPAFSGTTICLDRDAAQIASQPDTNPTPVAQPHNLAYVIYTSGSTGVPKGVQIEHRNLVNYSRFIAERLSLENESAGLRFATVSTIAADLGNTCIFPALISGSSVHLVNYETSTEAGRFAEYMQQHQIDVLKIVPSHLAALLNSPEAAQVLPRKYLVLGGEALTRQLLDKIRLLQPACKILNHYGPTETTVGSLTLKLDDFDWQHSPASSIPIGQPIANTQVYILDALHQPVPVGVTGELFIGGAGVTRGYLNQPQLTAERFLSNPFVSDAEARIYRTGDLARWLPDGYVEFLGRGDDQVKVRGFRIELGEIEAVLLRHSSVRQAVLLARESQPGDKQLVAYVIPHRDSSSLADDLRTYLKEQLPDYMIPSAIVPLEKLPLNSNGKVDRNALPAPELVLTKKKAYVAPSTPTQQVLVTIWTEILKVDPISIDDNFFDLGGHSLMATQVVSRIRRTLDVDLPLRTLFESPTITGLAEHIENARRSKTGLQAPAMEPVSREQLLPLSFAQQRLWFLDQLEPNNPLYNIARTLRLFGKLDADCLQRSLDEVVRRHESLRTTFSMVDGQAVQIITPSASLPVTVIDLTGLDEDGRVAEARGLSAVEAVQPFDLNKGPLLRATILRLDAEDNVLLFTMHHIVSDAWSAALFFNELSSLYSSYSKAQPNPLPPLKLQYADYAYWQRQWLQGETLEKQFQFWREQLQGAPPLLQLPTDRPRPEKQSFLGGHGTFFVPKKLANEVSALGRQEGATEFMTLLAAFNALLCRYSAQDQIVIGTDLANRLTEETERMIGFFINLLPLRTDLSGDPTFRELMARVRRSTLDAYTHQDMPFDKLVEELRPKRNLSYNPLVQVLFVMQNTPRTSHLFPEFRYERFDIPVTRSKFDLAVFVIQSDAGLRGDWLYSTDLFEDATIARMARHFETLLRNAIAQPDTRLSALEFLSDEEREQQSTKKQEQKKSQLKKLIAAEPKAVTLGQN